jgi:diguanylate cyclase (GGDEF)-like protein
MSSEWLGRGRTAASLGRVCLVAALALGVVVLLIATADAERRAATGALEVQQAAAGVSSAAVETENALRDASTRFDEATAQAFRRAVEQSRAASDAFTRHVDDDARAAEVVAATTSWLQIAQVDLDRIASGTLAPDAIDVRAPGLAAVVDAAATFRRTSERAVSSTQDRINLMGAAAVVALCALFGIGYHLLVARRERDEIRFREAQGAFGERLLMARAESDAVALLESHLRARLQGADVAVLVTDGEAGPVPDDVDDLTGRSRIEVGLIAGAERVGLVRVGSDRPLGPLERRVLEDSAVRAAPTVANLLRLAAAQVLAATDSLTGLANRREAEAALGRMVARARRNGGRFAVVLVDADRFKEVNDRHGHHRGDELLVAVARSLQRSARDYDVVGRRGGDEFVLVLDDVDASQAVAVAQRARLAVSGLDVPGVRASVSLGVAASADHPLDAHALLEAADRALYEVKARGGDGVALAEPTAQPTWSSAPRNMSATAAGA